MRDYKNLPTEKEAFNQYLRDNNTLIYENEDWIVIKNSYIENQLVIFSKHEVRYITECDHLQTLKEIIET